MLETTFELDGPKKVYQAKVKAQIEEDKQCMSMFGYKHPSAHRFYGYLLKCMRDCYEGKFEQLNVDLNYFLLLKNELSLIFLSKEENAMQLIKA